MTDLQAQLARVRLYALLTEQFCRRPWLETAELLLEGGADALQLREKELSDGELLARARTLRGLTRRAGALLIVNDRPGVALLSEADGVHVGQDDLPPDEVRRLVGPDAIVGWSTHSVEQARRAEQLPVDYIGVGPVEPTATKGYETGKGLELVSAAAREVALPVVAIGGIGLHNAGPAVEAGATAVAVCSALCGADDPAAAAAEIRAAVQAAHARRGSARD